MKRRLALLACACLLLLGLFPAHSFADNSPQLIKVDESLAVEMAQTFFDDVSDEHLTAADPTKLYNQEKEAIGYIVRAYSNGEPHGYVIFDKKRDFNIAEFALDKGMEPSIDRALQASPNVVNSDNELKYIQIDELTYAAVSSETLSGIDDCGADIELASFSSGVRSSSPSNWETDIFMDASYVYKNYSISSARMVSGYQTVTSGLVKSVTGRYACAVSAMYPVCSFYLPSGGLTNLKDDYLELWNLSDTTKVGNEGTVILGKTDTEKMGTGVTKFCSKRSTTVKSIFTYSPTWSRFKSTIDSNNVAIFSGRLASNNAGHGMFVAGYASLVDKHDVLQSMNTLLVNDGWYSGLKYLPYTTSYYDNYDGTFFSK